MGSPIEKLLQHSSLALGAQMPLAFSAAGLHALGEMLSARNGFFAFGGALHVYPVGPEDELDIELTSLNASNLWRRCYLALGARLAFGQDAFGDQYLIDPETGAVSKLDADAGGIIELGPDLDSWARLVLEDYEVETGYALVHQWHTSVAAFDPTTRLVPRRPFAIGGEFDAANLEALPSRGLLERRSEKWASRLADKPDGTRIDV